MLFKSEILIMTEMVRQVRSHNWTAPLDNPLLVVGTLREVCSARYWAFYCLRLVPSRFSVFAL